MINTVYELITDVMAKQYPDRVAFRYVAADGKTVVEKTYAQYVQDIRRAVTYFKENIPDIKGKRVGIMSRNCYEYGVNSFGAILAGAVVVTINQKKTKFPRENTILVYSSRRMVFREADFPYMSLADLRSTPAIPGQRHDSIAH